jgi:hypothetical protein
MCVQLIVMVVDMIDGTRDEIVRLAAQAEELAARIESCRKFILAGWVAIVTAGLVLLAMLIGLIGSDPSDLQSQRCWVASWPRARTAARPKRQAWN